MPRRDRYTDVKKSNRVKAGHVKGMGDVVFKGFQCLNGECEQFIFVRKDDLSEDFEVICPRCHYKLHATGESKFYDYDLVKREDGSIIQSGEFIIFHDDYLAEAQEFKYCIICNALKPLFMFDRHSPRRSGRQGECRLCKGIYNNIKNQTRLPDQHREAAQKRRLYMDLSGGKKINSSKVYERFGYHCFNCGRDLKETGDPRERPLDHTLPVVYLWPLTTESSTLLCRDCNGEKAGRWPNEFYSLEKLRKLSAMTGIDFAVLNGPPQYNPEALTLLYSQGHVDSLIARFAAYMPELIRLRNRLLKDIGFDFFQVSSTLSAHWKHKADEDFAKMPLSGRLTVEPSIDVP